MQVAVHTNGPLTAKYVHMSTRFDPEQQILWTLLDPLSVPCFNLELLTELRHHHDAIEASGGQVRSDATMANIRYSVLASLTPGIFNLGGQLALFKRLIVEHDKKALLHYATKCVDVIAQRVHHFGLPLATITLVQGDALGGGFEAALTSDVIIAERSAQMGFPEILFNLFPGMGAYSLVARKAGTRIAEKMILSGRIYSAEELYDMGLVDVLAEDGDGVNALHDYIRKQERRANGFMALQKAKQRFSPLPYEELFDITTVWVDAALKLCEKDLKVMDRLIRSQEKLFVPAAHQQIA